MIRHEGFMKASCMIIWWKILLTLPTLDLPTSIIRYRDSDRDRDHEVSSVTVTVTVTVTMSTGYGPYHAVTVTVDMYETSIHTCHFHTWWCFSLFFNSSTTKSSSIYDQKWSSLFLSTDLMHVSWCVPLCIYTDSAVIKVLHATHSTHENVYLCMHISLLPGPHWAPSKRVCMYRYTYVYICMYVCIHMCIYTFSKR